MSDLPRLEHVGLPGGGALVVVRDDCSGARYGGNKARKYRGILPIVERAGARELCTVGAVGSHHVLATAVFAEAAGLRARCFVVAQPDVPSAHENLRRAVGLGAQLEPCGSEAEAALRHWWASRQPGVFGVPVGGSSLAGSLPFVDVARVLLGQPIRDLVVALGSGGTAAGLLVGATLLGLPLRVHAVTTAGPRPVVRGLLVSQVLGLLRARGALGRAREAFARLRVVDGQLGAGYARPTAASVRAGEIAASVGLPVDPVYTAKALAHALDLARRGDQAVAFWHTYSTVDMAWIDRRAPRWDELPVSLRGLFRR